MTYEFMPFEIMPFEVIPFEVLSFEIMTNEVRPKIYLFRTQKSFSPIGNFLKTLSCYDL